MTSIRMQKALQQGVDSIFALLHIIAEESAPLTGPDDPRLDSVAESIRGMMAHDGFAELFLAQAFERGLLGTSACTGAERPGDFVAWREQDAERRMSELLARLRALKGP